MPRKDTPRFKLAYGWDRGEDWWGDPTSENRVMTDALLHPAPISNTLMEPPADAIDGDQYIVPVGATGAWEGQDNKLAMLVEGSWVFVAPVYGLRVRVRSVGMFLWWDGEKWEPEPLSPIPSVEQGKAYDIAISVGYAPDPGEMLLILPIVQSMALPEGGAGSMATAAAPPIQDVRLEIRRNGVEVGGIIFRRSTFGGEFDIPGNVVFGPGDRLQVMCPLTLPANFQGFGAVLRLVLL